MDYRFYFNNAKKANYFYERACEIAKEYGIVRLSDLCDLIDQPYNYQANKIIWAANTIRFDVIYDFENFSDNYCLKFPEPDQYPASERESCQYYCDITIPSSNIVPKQTPTPEPLNITILMDPSKDPYATIREVIQQANTIKDRPVFITIN